MQARKLPLVLVTLLVLLSLGLASCDLFRGNEKPVASFSFTPPSPRMGEEVLFDGSASYDPDGEIVSYRWDFGDGTTGSGITVTHTYNDSGSYTVTLEVKDNRGATDSTSRTVTVSEGAGGRPRADFTFSPPDPTTGDTIQFTDQSTDPDGEIVSWSWDFGDGSTSLQQNPTHRYASPGDYTVTLTVMDDDGLTDSTSKVVSVSSPGELKARFTFEPSQPRVGETITFDASTSSGQIISYRWDFGDGETGSGITVTHSYDSPGNYEVTLTVTDDKGATDSISRVVTVVKEGGGKPPRADFTFSPSNPYTGEIVQFTDKSTDPDGTITSWRWDFGDGTSSLKQNPTHRYQQGGRFTVKLTVMDDDGLTGSKEKVIEVRENTVPVAVFTVPARPIVGEEVTFDGSASYDDGEIVSYVWDFGDGTTGSGAVVTHVYNAPGSYQVTLTVTDDTGLTGSLTLPVFVSSGEVKVIESFSSPGPDPRGLAWDGKYLWCADVDKETIYKINPDNGQVVSSFPSPGVYPLGLAWDGSYLWNIDPIEEKILKIDPRTGRVVNEPGIDIPGPDPTGLAWGGGYLWVADGERQEIYKIDPSDGHVVDSFSSPGEFPKGLAWDGSYLWNIDMVDGLYMIDPETGRVAASYNFTPGPRAEGLAFDGRHLWAADSEEDKIYKISL